MSDQGAIKVRVLSVQGIVQSDPPAGYANTMTVTANVHMPDGSYHPAWEGLKVMGPAWAPNVLLGIPDLEDEEQATGDGVWSNGDLHVRIEWKPLVGPCNGGGGGGGYAPIPIDDSTQIPGNPMFGGPLPQGHGPLTRLVVNSRPDELALLMRAAIPAMSRETLTVLKHALESV